MILHEAWSVFPVLSQCALFTAEQGQWLQAVQVCSGLCQWSEAACTLWQPPAPGPGWARLLALTGSSCCGCHRAEAEIHSQCGLQLARPVT